MGTHAAFPQVPNQSGLILTTPTLVTIVAANDTSTGTDTAANLQAFSDALPSSALWDAVSNEYGVGDMTPIAIVTPGAVLMGAQTKADIQDYVEGLVTSGGAPAPNGDTIYLLYLPAAASLASSDFGKACSEHFQYPTTATDAIAVVERCTPQQSGETQLGELTRNASHEVVEAATNPRQGGYNFNETMDPGVSNIWAVWNGGDVELADLCEGTRTFESIGSSSPSGGWEFQRVWSNEAAALGGDPCVPAATDPYFSVGISSGWYTVQPGQSVTVPFTGWSASSTTDWFLNEDMSTSTGTFAVSLPTSSLGDTEVPPGCGARYAMNAGDTGSVTITAPSTALPGQYAVLRLTSFRETAACGDISDGCGGTLACGVCNIAGET